MPSGNGRRRNTTTLLCDNHRRDGRKVGVDVDRIRKEIVDQAERERVGETSIAASESGIIVGGRWSMRRDCA